MTLIKTYKLNASGKKKRIKDQEALMAEGWKVISEEEQTKFDGGKACCLAVIFLPLAFIGQSKVVKVTYEK